MTWRVSSVWSAFLFAVLMIAIPTVYAQAPSDFATEPDKDMANAHHWTVGSKVSVTYPDGTTDQQTVGAVFQHTDITGDLLISPQAWSTHDPQRVDQQVLVATAPGVGLEKARAQVASVARPYGSPRVQSRSQFRNDAAGGVTGLPW